jgi:ferredoxin/coenzyme F420-reducing hydrogenase delta subunit
MTVILCRCMGSHISGVTIDAVRDALSEKGETVLIGDTLCSNGIGPMLRDIESKEPIVIGGCWCEGHKNEFMEEMRKARRDPFALRLVPMLGDESPASIILMLTAASERMKLYRGVLQENLKPRFGSTDGSMSRRQFLKFPRIRYDVVPSIDITKCRCDEKDCNLCLRKCGNDALYRDERQMKVRSDKCSGCGACVNACPADAVCYPGYTHAEITREIEVLLENAGDAESRRSILFVCEESDLVRSDFFLTGGALPKGVLPVVVPCLKMLNSFYMAYPVFRGAIKVGLLSCTEGRCRKGETLKKFRGEREFTEALFDRLGIGKERLAWIEAGSLPVLNKKLLSFDASLHDSEALPHLNLGSASFAPEQALRSLLAKPEFRDIRITGFPAIPYGMVRAGEEASCTFCGVCEKRCPANALAITEEDGRRELRFTYGECAGCGECVKSCPERLLSIKRELDADKLASGHVYVLAAETKVLCKECGSPFLNEALLRKFRTDLPAGDSFFLSRLCPFCRVKTALQSMGMTDAVSITAGNEAASNN